MSLHVPEKKMWKPTIIESQRSFILHVKTINDLKIQLQSLREFYKSRNLTLQPLVIVVGLDLKNLTEFYVSYDNILFKLPTILKAIDCCFKIFHVFSLKYPLASNQCWTLIQILLFNISTEHDTINNNLNIIMKYLKN